MGASMPAFILSVGCLAVPPTLEYLRLEVRRFPATVGVLG
jgi:hypothetical protein